MKYIGSLLFALSIFVVVPGCDGSSETGVIEADVADITSLEEQMNADAAEADAAMAAEVEE